jgi:hypothetical protein
MTAEEMMKKRCHLISKLSEFISFSSLLTCGNTINENIKRVSKIINKTRPTQPNLHQILNPQSSTQPSTSNIKHNLARLKIQKKYIALTHPTTQLSSHFTYFFPNKR